MPLNAVTPRMIDATRVTPKLSNRSAAMPAQSPTLSPTLSAIVAGLRGSSSGMPASTLPDQVGPDVGGLGEDAAADPQEQGEQRAAETEADQDHRGRVLEQQDDGRGAEQAEPGGGQTADATGAERHLAGRSGSRYGVAAAVVRMLPRVASHMPRNPIEADAAPPTRKASVRNRPDWAKLERDASRCPE